MVPLNCEIFRLAPGRPHLAAALLRLWRCFGCTFDEPMREVRHALGVGESQSFLILRQLAELGLIERDGRRVTIVKGAHYCWVAQAAVDIIESDSALATLAALAMRRPVRERDGFNDFGTVRSAQIERILGVCAKTISRALRVLRQAGFVLARWTSRGACRGAYRFLVACGQAVDWWSRCGVRFYERCRQRDYDHCLRRATTNVRGVRDPDPGSDSVPDEEEKDGSDRTIAVSGPSGEVLGAQDARPRLMARVLKLYEERQHRRLVKG